MQYKNINRALPKKRRHFVISNLLFLQSFEMLKLLGDNYKCIIKADLVCENKILNIILLKGLPQF